METRVASVSWFMTVAGHVASKFDVVHDIDLLDKEGRPAGATVPGSYLLPDPDMSLPDEDTGVVDGLGQPQLEHLHNKSGRELINV